MKTFIILSLFIFSICNSIANSNTAYADFGGKKAIKKVVDDMLFNLLADKRTKRFFEFTDNEHIKEKLVEQFCEQLGGPCKYSGVSMKESHEGQDINRGHFYALVEQLQKAMNKNNIPQSAQTALLSKLAVMHKEIVTK